MKESNIFLLIIYLVTVAFLCFGHFSYSPEAPQELFSIPLDKVVHFLMFMPFPVLCRWVFYSFRDNTRTVIRNICFFLVVGVVLAYMTEYIQGLLEYRTKDVTDLLSDTLGMVFSSFIILIVKVTGIYRKRC